MVRGGLCIYDRVARADFRLILLDMTGLQEADEAATSAAGSRATVRLAEVAKGPRS
jgi:hypothetical protein